LRVTDLPPKPATSAAVVRRVIGAIDVERTIA